MCMGTSPLGTWAAVISNTTELLIFSATFFLTEQTKKYSDKILNGLYFLIAVHLIGLSASNHLASEFQIALIALIVIANLRTDSRSTLLWLNSALAVILTFTVFSYLPLLYKTSSPEIKLHPLSGEPLYFFINAIFPGPDKNKAEKYNTGLNGMGSNLKAITFA